jgi:hypothetical protein
MRVSVELTPFGTLSQNLNTLSQKGKTLLWTGFLMRGPRWGALGFGTNGTKWDTLSQGKTTAAQGI